MRLRSKNVLILGPVIGIVVAVVITMPRLPLQHAHVVPQNYTLPNDDFNETTVQKLRGFINSEQVLRLHRKVYVLTGGIGTANPRILAWDGVGSITLGRWGQSDSYEIQETSINPSNLKEKDGTPIHWKNMVTETGREYFKYIPFTNKGLVWYYFQEGDTYIRLTILSSVNKVTPFPDSILSHLQPVN